MSNPNTQPIPEKLVSELVEDDPEMIDIVEEFVAGLTGRINDLQSAHQQTDWERLTTLAHQLKGAGGSYGYPALSATAAEMEQGFRQQLADDFAQRIAHLHQLVAAAQAGLQG